MHVLPRWLEIISKLQVIVPLRSSHLVECQCCKKKETSAKLHPLEVPAGLRQLPGLGDRVLVVSSVMHGFIVLVSAHAS